MEALGLHLIQDPSEKGGVLAQDQGLSKRSRIIHLCAFNEFVARFHGAHAHHCGHLVPLLLALQRHRLALVPPNLNANERTVHQ